MGGQREGSQSVKVGEEPGLREPVLFAPKRAEKQWQQVTLFLCSSVTGAPAPGREGTAGGRSVQIPGSSPLKFISQ